MQIALVTDSTCDLPESLLRLHQIQVIPNLVVMEGQEYQDGVNLDRETFYNHLPALKSQPTTAAASIGSYSEAYANAFAAGANKVLSIHCAAALSGIYNTARLAAEAFDGRVEVLDSGQLSLGVGFQVLAAARAAAAGQDWQGVLQQVRSVQSRLRVMAMLDTLEYVRRSGRISWTKARLSAMLQMRPLVELVNGEVISRGQSRTRSKGIEHLAEVLLSCGPLQELAILHTNAACEAAEFWQSLKLPASLDPLFVNVTTVIGAHLGPRGLGFAAVVK